MNIPPSISDELLIRLIDRVARLISISEARIEKILGEDISLSKKLRESTRENIVRIIHITVFQDRWRRYASYPHVEDPVRSLRYWFRRKTDTYDGHSPLALMTFDGASGIRRIYEDMYIEEDDFQRGGVYRSLRDGSPRACASVERQEFGK